jgi:hypothetical protein
MRCRVVICAACTTRLDGVNHCHACLKAMGTRRAEAAPRRVRGAAVALLLFALGWLPLFGLLLWLQGRYAR